MRGCSLMGVPSRSGGVAEELGRSLSPSGTMTSSSYCNLYYYCRRLVCIDGDERASASRLGAGLDMVWRMQCNTIAVRHELYN
jgi:hypothetical protein